jgi:hypothetical protein
MNTLKTNQHGFIPLLLSVIFVVILGIIFVYLRVAHAHQ